MPRAARRAWHGGHEHLCVHKDTTATGAGARRVTPAATQKWRSFVSAAEEDFGITPVEVQARFAQARATMLDRLAAAAGASSFSRVSTAI